MDVHIFDVSRLAAVQFDRTSNRFYKH